MARPALVIGLGGTGQWVLTYLKRDLLEAGGGTWPDGVSLRAFDTVENPSAFIGANGNQNVSGGLYNQAARVGSVMLKKGIEYIYYGQNIFSMVDRIFADHDTPNDMAANPYHCQTWLKQSLPDFLQYPAQIFNVNVGAGAIRQVGHLAFIGDIRQNGSVILTAIDNAINEIKKTRTPTAAGASLDYSRVLEVIFVASLAGGTGAGIMIDFAAWCRHLLDAKFPGAVTYRAFLVAPEAFTQPGPAQDTDMMARSFAAWRELNRFQAVNQDVGRGIICYDSVNPLKQIPLNKRLFDATYIIDPRRTLYPLPAGQEPKTNLFPSIAQAIAAILDDKSGGAFTEQAINLTKTQADHKTAHNAIGTYSIKVPIYHHLEDFTFLLQKEVWSILLAPELNNGRCVNLLRNSNRERLPADGGKAAVIKDLKAASFAYQGKAIPNTGFWRLIGLAAQELWHVDNNPVIAKDADKFRMDGNINTHCDNGILHGINNDPVGDVALREYGKEKGKSLKDWITYSLEKGETPCEGITRIPGESDSVISNHYDTENGTFIKNVLLPAGEVQIKLFAAYIKAILEAELNGHDANPINAKGGKIGWVESYLESLRDVLKDYQSYCEKVVNNANGKVNSEIQKNITKATKYYKDHACDSHWITKFDKNVHPRAWDSERKYVEARVADAYFQKEAALFLQHAYVTGIAKKLVEATLEDLQSWKATLATGKTVQVEKNVEKFIDGVYNRIQIEEGNIQAEYQANNAASAVSENVGETVYVTSPTQIQNLFDQIRWNVEVDGERGQGGQVARPNRLDFSLSWSGTSLSKPPIFEHAVESDLRVSEEKCKAEFLVMIGPSPANTVGTVLQANYPNANDLADYLLQKAEPWWQERVGGFGSYHTIPCQALLAVSPGAAPAYFDQVVARLNILSPIGVVHERKDRADSFKLTLVRYDNVIESEDFQAYQECRDAYKQMYLSPGILPKRNLEHYHIFPAEVNAAKYERKVSEILHLNFDTLKAETVVLLDDDQRIELFFRAVALGLIRFSAVVDPGKSPGLAWVCQMNNTSAEIRLTSHDADFGAIITTDYRKLISQFAYKGTDIRPGIANQVDYPTLDTEIRVAQAAGTAIALYQQQYNLPIDNISRSLKIDAVINQLNSVVADLTADTKTQVPRLIYPILADLALKGENDLCHLGETILRFAANDPVTPMGRALVP